MYHRRRGTSTSIVLPQTCITLRDMAKAVVLLFLLDSLPDFNNVINNTLHKFAPGMIGVTCNPSITAPVLEIIGKKLNLTANSVEKLQNIEAPYKLNIPSHKSQELSPDSLNNIGFVGNSLEISYEYSIEKHTPDLIQHNYIRNATKEEVIDLPISKRIGNTKMRFPESALFLAAMFETVGNVTAQTCGGVVLARNLVLTAASCVNVISPFYSKTSNETTDNYYDVVIGAANPLKDGSIHRVRAIYIHPTPDERRNSKQNWSSLSGLGTNDISPRLALLKIDPGVEEGILQMMEHETDWDGVNGRMYGWLLKQKESGFTMMATSMPTNQLSSARCEKAYGIVETKNTTFCLSVNDTSNNAVKMLAGCPMVVLQDGGPKLLGVALTDEMQPLLAGTLHAHRGWLRKLMLAGK